MHALVARLMGMKTQTNARKLDQATQAHPRRMVVRAVHDGMTRVEAVRTYGAGLRAVGNWMKLA